MNWYAVPFGDTHIQILNVLYKGDFIPRLFILDPNGELISANGLNDIITHKEKAFDLWAKTN